MSDINKVRNFAIIAHIDHGKSTIADRMIQICGGLSAREMKEQVLDSMDIERERGITIKAQTVKLNYKSKDGNEYILNIIDKYISLIKKETAINDDKLKPFIEKLGKNIMSQLITKWSTQQSNFIKVYIVLKGADFMSYMTFESFLKAQTVSGIRNAYAKSLNEGVAEYEVEFEGKSQALAMGLAQTSPDGLTFKVTGLTGNRITAEVVQ